MKKLVLALCAAMLLIGATFSSSAAELRAGYNLSLLYEVEGNLNREGPGDLNFIGDFSYMFKDWVVKFSQGTGPGIPTRVTGGRVLSGDPDNPSAYAGISFTSRWIDDNDNDWGVGPTFAVLIPVFTDENKDASTDRWLEIGANVDVTMREGWNPRVRAGLFASYVFPFL